MATKFFEEGLCTRTILLIPKKMKILFVFFSDFDFCSLYKVQA